MPRTVTPLADEQLAAIASAPAEVTAASLARALSAEYATVAAALRRIRRDGWSCRLIERVCTVCGGPLLSPVSVGRRVVHPACTAASHAAHQRRYRREGRARKSTPYVARWRSEHPAELAAEREREKAAARAHWPDLPEEQRGALLDKLHRADRRDYPLTRDEAEHGGEPWDADEDQYVLDHLRDPAREVALALGRTLWAVRGRRVRLRRQGAGGAGGAAAMGRLDS